MANNKNAEREPLIRLAKRDSMPKNKVWLIRFAAFLLALVIGGIIFLIAGYNPFKTYSTIVTGSLSTSIGRKQVIINAIPLLGTALALAPCFKMRYWNIGAEGQITVGAMCSSFFALYCAKGLPGPVLILVMALAGVAGGAVWAFIPAFFKAKYRTNETLFTLMMNYIAIGIVAWLQGGPWEGRPGTQIIPMFDEKAWLPKLFGVQIGWLVVLVLTFVVFIYMRYTKHGYEVAVLGESENTARYAGMNVTKVVSRTALFSGAISGLVGFLIVSGTNYTLLSTVAGGVGFTAITVCWLAQLNPFAMIAISLVLAVLEKGASAIQTSLKVPASISDILTGLILLCMLGCEFFINYRMNFRGKEAHE